MVSRAALHRFTAVLFLFVFTGYAALSQDSQPKKFDQEDKFRQLEEILPTPNAYRTASGAPGHAYWQQKVDYNIEVEVDDKTQRIIGSETITYKNNSPDTLRYLWVQLDNNNMAKGAESALIAPAPDLERVPLRSLKAWLARQTFDGGVKIASVRDGKGKPLPQNSLSP